MADNEEDDDAILTEAMIATEKEIFGAGFGQEDTDPLDASGDRSLEDMGDGLEGQHESDDDEESEEGDESETGEEGQDGDGEEGKGEEEGEAAKAAKAADEAKPKPEPKPEGRVPSGRLREQTERADKAEAALKAMQDDRERERSDFNKRFDDLRTLVMQQRQPDPAKPAEPKPDVVPDYFENPEQSVLHLIRREFETEQQKRQQQERVDYSFMLADTVHGEEYQKADAAVRQLDPNNPVHVAIVQGIVRSKNPGAALMSWYKQEQARREVGDDPAAYRNRVATETRQALMQDPEFRKQLLDELRAEASGVRTGKPNTVTRLPKSLNGAAGTSTTRDMDTGALDPSDQAIFDSAFRS